jgi:hypothetical protein
MNDNNKRACQESWRTIIKEVIFIVLGFVLGFGGNYYSQYLENKKIQNDTVQLLRLSTQHELDLCSEAKEMILGKAPPHIAPQTFDALFQPILLPEAENQILHVSPRVIRATIELEFSLKQARMMRDFEHDALARSNGNIYDQNNTALAGLKFYLDDVTAKGGLLITAIDEDYPK